jgi:GntR family transcriptional regulator/MocR family aminotransferase
VPFDLAISLVESDATPLHRQLYEHLRRSILDRRLAAGSRLPSTRALARQLRVARNTVSAAYDQLLAEGYLRARGGSGTYVCETLPDEAFVPGRRLRRGSVHEPASAQLQPPLSRWTLRALEGAHLDLGGPAADQLPFDFHHGSPAVDRFPIDLWRRLLARRLRARDVLELGYAPSNGHAGLREAVATYLRRTRALRCTAEQVVVVNGSQQALDLLARVCLEPGDAVVMEDPGYVGARRAFAAHGARVIPARVDDSGLVVEALDAVVGSAAPRLLYVTPSHQFPTGSLLSLPRRLALLRWARARGTLILEDDYDSEFRYSGHPVEALQGLDVAGTVVYIGTFSKVLFPALRLGYVILPPALVEAVATAKWLSDRYSPMLEQQVLADFFAEGHFERHLRHMRLIYQARHDAFLEGVARELGDLVLPPIADTGLHALLGFTEPLPERDLVARAAAAGVGIYPARAHYLAPPARTELIMGYTSLDARQIGEGLRRLGRVVRALRHDAACAASSGGRRAARYPRSTDGVAARSGTQLTAHGN